MARVALNRAAQPTVRSKPKNYPAFIPPAQATNLGRAPSAPGWGHEIKYDGYRSQLHLRDGKVTIYSKNGHDWTGRYALVADAAAKLDIGHAVVDGEMVVLRDDGTCDLHVLKSHVSGGPQSERLAYFAFDLLFLNGDDLRRLPLIERKQKLKGLLADAEEADRLCFVEHVEGDGPTIWSKMHAYNVEGIVSKRLNAPYRSGRGEDWIKTPCEYRERLVIAGMSFDGEKFDGLHLARRKGGALTYAGKIDGQIKYGFGPDVVAELRKRLQPLITKRQPVSTSTPKRDARWVEPVLEAQIAHRGGIGVERVRRPIFQGVIGGAVTRRAKGSDPLRAKAPASGLLPENIQRELPDAVVPTKAQLQTHWRKVGKLALAHLANRPLTLVRHLDGVTFFHQGPLPPVPRSVHQLEIRKADGSKGVRLYVDSVAGLLGLLDIGVVEVHPWAATIEDIERPDFMIFDLDRGDGIEWDFVVETALALRKLLADEGYDCWPKLTGGSGLHIMVPIERALTHRQVHLYSLELANRVVALRPNKYTTTPGAANRVGKLFIDCLRNGRGYTAVGAYSPRARTGATVATPVSWAQMAKGVRPADFALAGLPATATGGVTRIECPGAAGEETMRS